MTVAPVRPVTGDQPGWPRPRMRPYSLLKDDLPATLPVPFIAPVEEHHWVPEAYDGPRGSRVKNEDLCQVCGGSRGGVVYAVAGQTDLTEDCRYLSQSGGALCSLRCARLTAAVCPHYRRQAPVHVYEVPHLGERVSTGSLRELDDCVDLTSLGVRHVDTVTVAAP